MTDKELCEAMRRAAIFSCWQNEELAKQTLYWMAADRIEEPKTGTEPRPSDAQISLEVCDVIDADYKDGGVW